MSLFDLFKKQSLNEAESTSSVNMKTEETVKNVETEHLEEKAGHGNADAMAGSRKVFNLIILDESGSMQAIYHPALSGVNETLQTIRDADKEHADQEHFVSLISFDTRHYNEIYKCTMAEAATDITEEQYRPHGGTPLYDAMGRAINELRNHVGKDDIVLVTVITDGYENASQEYTGEAIKSLVEELKGKGWVFTYIGANQHVDAVASSMSISNSLAFSASAEGTSAMFDKERSSRKRFFSKIAPNICPSDIAEDYFD